jgi:hypothetical protein
MPTQRVAIVNGNLEADQVRAFLEAHGIQVLVLGEAIRSTHGFVRDGLGAVTIEVAEEDADRARQLLAAADAGEFWLEEDSSHS